MLCKADTRSATPSSIGVDGEEVQAWGDAGYQGADKQPDAKASVRWRIAMRPDKRKLLDHSRLKTS